MAFEPYVTNTGCRIEPPAGDHDWLPTPTFLRYQCQRCSAKVTKADLMDERVPKVCKARRRKYAA